MMKMGLRYVSTATSCSKSDKNNNLFNPRNKVHPITVVQKNLVSTAITSNPENLPHFPLPKLEDTLQKYLRSVQPLLAKEKFQKTLNAVEEFSKPNGSGARLHTLLKSRADTCDNWLSDWWTKVAYLSYRIPVVVNSNPGLYFPTKFFENEFQWCRYAAQIIWASLRYKQMIDHNEIPVEKAGKYPLDMAQYKKIYGTCRVPARDVDEIIFNPNSRHIIVVYKNGFYKVPVYEDSCDKFLSENQLIEQLLLVIRRNESEDVPVGILTTEHRDTLAVAYENLIKDPVNRESVDCIQKALFVICLDQPVPNYTPGNDFNVASHQLIHGGGSTQNSGNRWFDKTLQFVVNRNGVNGINYEHSPAEGQPIAVLTDYILNHVKNDATENEIVNSSSYKPPVKLAFNISAATQQDIKVAQENIDKLAANLDMNVVQFKSYGKNFIKSQKMSPDSFIQMAMQYAFYKLHGEPGAHYETAQQRMFIHGRTETIRSCSLESIAFAKAMCAPRNTVSDQEKVMLLKEAVKGHKDYTVMAMAGEGVDRHLLGLKLIARENNLPIPDFYNDEAYTKSTHFRVSTSQVASSGKAFMCYGPVVDDGYGICYNPRNDDIFLAVSAFNSCPSTSATEMARSLTEALENMYQVLSKAGERRMSKL